MAAYAQKNIVLVRHNMLLRLFELCEAESRSHERDLAPTAIFSYC